VPDSPLAACLLRSHAVKRLTWDRPACSRDQAQRCWTPTCFTTDGRC